MTATCPRCGRQIRVVIPKGGDGSANVFIRHKTSPTCAGQLPSRQCSGSRMMVDPILSQLDAPARETLIREALKTVLETRTGDYGAKKKSVIEEAFAQACGKLTFDVIDKLVQSDETVRAQIESFAKDAIANLLTGANKADVLDAFNTAFTKALRGY